MATTGCGTTGAERTTRHVHDTSTVSTTVIEAIADLESVPPLELDIPLYDAVDPDALDALCADATEEFRLSFQVAAYDVRIHGGETVVVERQAMSA